MRLRIFTEPQQGATYDQLLAVARAAEELGFDGFFRSDHYLRMGDDDAGPGPTGAQTALQVALGDAGIPGLGLWAQVPHYVSATPSPPAISALLSRVRELAGVETDLTVLDGQVDEYLQRVEEGLSERPDVAEMVRNIEASEDSGEIPSGDELASEIERFLREQG